MDHYANTLYETARRRDLDLFDYSASTMMSVISADAVAAAEDSTLASYIDSVHHQLAHLVQLSNWSACYNFLEAKTFVAPGRVPITCRRNTAPVFIALIRSANASKWQARGSSEGQEHAGRRVMEEARALVAADGDTAAAGGSLGPRPMPHCQGELRLVGGRAHRGGAARAAAGSGATTGYKPPRVAYAATFIACSSRPMPSSITASAAVSGTRMRMALA